MKKKYAWIPVILSLTAVVLLFHATASGKVETNGLNKSKLTVRVGKTKVLKMKGIKKKVLWKSSNKKVASVSAEGVVSGIARGTAVVTARYEKNVSNVRFWSLGKTIIPRY